MRLKITDQRKKGMIKADKKLINKVVAMKDKPDKPIGRIRGFYRREAILCPWTNYMVPLKQLVLYKEEK